MPNQQPSYLLARLDRARTELARHKVDALLLTHPADLAYLTDFSGEDSYGVLTASKLTLVTDFRYTEQARQECPWVPVATRSGSMADAVTKVLRAAKVQKVAFDATHTSYAAVAALRKSLSTPPKGSKRKPQIPSLKVADGMMTALRKVKDGHEIGILREAVKIAEAAFLAVRPTIRPGQTENTIGARLVFEMRKRGATDSSFPPIVGTQGNSALPHYRPGNIAVKTNAALLFDWGARYKGYCSDLTRTLMLGKAPAKVKEIYQIVLDAQLAAIDFLRPGVSTVDADAVARKIITKAGYGKEFGHSLGHGIGRDIHEQPSLRKLGKPEPLVPGMVVTVEPGIYLPGIGGVRIEDDVLITENGCEVLSSLPKSLKDNTVS